jgi:hypothetical protein
VNKNQRVHPAARYQVRPDDGLPKCRGCGQYADIVRQERIGRRLLLYAQFSVEYDVDFAPGAGLVAKCGIYAGITKERADLVPQAARQA